LIVSHPYGVANLKGRILLAVCVVAEGCGGNDFLFTGVYLKEVNNAGLRQANRSHIMRLGTALGVIAKNI
jgi:hypothetical protein